MSKQTTPEDVQAKIKKHLSPVQIPVLPLRRVKKGRLPDEIAVVAVSEDKVALSLLGDCIGHIVRTDGENGKVWKAQEIDYIRSADLHRVCYELAAHHPPL